MQTPPDTCPLPDAKPTQLDYSVIVMPDARAVIEGWFPRKTFAVRFTVQTPRLATLIPLVAIVQSHSDLLQSDRLPHSM